MPEVVGRTLEIADACHFSLDELRYQFPRGGPAAGPHRPELAGATWSRRGCGSATRGGVPEDGAAADRGTSSQLIEKLDVRRVLPRAVGHRPLRVGNGILCQGRGSAANSAVCYALRITSIDPVRMGLLFERFLSLERPEPPDIDVDFEHERREEVLQYVYEKHGRHRAAMVCEVICYRGRLAVREVGKALGLSLDQVDRLAKAHRAVGDRRTLTDAQLRRGGAVAGGPGRCSRRWRWPESWRASRGTSPSTWAASSSPTGELAEVVPVENASMKDRTVVQWEKDDLNALGIFKVDLLGLGMLTVLSKSFALIEKHEGIRLDLATIPGEDPAVYRHAGRGGRHRRVPGREPGADEPACPG